MPRDASREDGGTRPRGLVPPSGAVAALKCRRTRRVREKNGPRQGVRARDRRSTRMSVDGNTQLPRVVIVGAGFGGLQAARSLARAPVRVTVIDRNNYHLFQPLLYQVASAALSPADIAVPIRGVLRRQRNTEVLLGEVTGVDTQRREVHVRDRAGAHDVEVPYEYLVVATGAMVSYFGHDAWASFAPGLKSIEEAMAIRSQILLAFEAAEQEMAVDPLKASALLTTVIVGGGPTGVELAGAIAEAVRKALAKDFRHIDPTM